MDPAAPTAPRKPPLHGWRGLLILAALALGGTLLAAVVWFTSDADLRRVERDMAATGLPTTWKALGVERVDAQRLQIYGRIAALAKVLKPWKPTKPFAFEPGTPPSPELKAWHERLPKTEVSELLEFIDHLPAERVFLSQTFDFPQLHP
jgi:hypothetical protein